MASIEKEIHRRLTEVLPLVVVDGRSLFTNRRDGAEIPTAQPFPRQVALKMRPPNKAMQRATGRASRR